MLSIYILYKDIILVIGLLISIWLRSLCLAELDLDYAFTASHIQLQLHHNSVQYQICWILLSKVYHWNFLSDGTY